MGDIEWVGLDEAFDTLEEECAAVVRGISVRLWSNILQRTPQFYGRMAASWSYTLGAPSYVDRTAQVEFEGPRKLVAGNLQPSQGLYRGHPTAIGVANNASRGNDSGFKLGMTIYIANGVDHGEGGYSQAIENGEVRLRAVNQPGAPVTRSIDSLRANFGDDISARQAARLKELRVGD